VAATLQWLPGARESGSLAFIVVGSLVVSLYALGVAAWVAEVDRGHLARRFRASVVCWWLMLVLGTLGFAFGTPSPGTSRTESGAFIGDRVISDWWYWPMLGLMIASYWLLAGAHHVVKQAMRELAEEDALQLTNSSRSRHQT
jgi:cytochrome bd-type quinol oxidase subunit 2